MDSIFKPLAHWLREPSVELGTLLEQLDLLKRYTTVLRNHLPAPLATHCSASNVSSGILVITADSSAWATKLRYLQPRMVAYLQTLEDLPSVSQIRIRVQQPAYSIAAKTATRHPLMSRHAGKTIEEVAAATRDPVLRTALQRLARHAYK